MRRCVQCSGTIEFPPSRVRLRRLSAKEGANRTACTTTLRCRRGRHSITRRTQVGKSSTAVPPHPCRERMNALRLPRLTSPPPYVRCCAYICIVCAFRGVVDRPPGEPPGSVLLDRALASEPEESLQRHRGPVARGFGGQRRAPMGQREREGRGKMSVTSSLLRLLLVHHSYINRSRPYVWYIYIYTYTSFEKHGSRAEWRVRRF